MKTVLSFFFPFVILFCIVCIIVNLFLFIFGSNAFNWYYVFILIAATIAEFVKSIIKAISNKNKPIESGKDSQKKDQHGYRWHKQLGKNKTEPRKKRK